MCINKVRVYDHIRREYNYFNCGRCPACRQAIANRRSRRIRAHEDGHSGTCYFLTLSYDNKFVPYIKKSDVLSLKEHFFDTVNDVNYSLSIYRDYSYRTYRDREIVKPNSDPIGYLQFDPSDSRTFIGLSDLSGIRTKIKSNPLTFKYDPDKISVAFSKDARDFFKRLRTNIFRDLGQNETITYYYAPEYGPDSQRFHIHLLIWFPKRFTYSFILRHILKAWPYGDKERTTKYLQVARSPANYLASYVNCDSTVSKFLTSNFKLRPSHSKDFGLSSTLFSFQNVLQAYQQRKSFEYDTTTVDKNGVVTNITLPYPRYLRSRYFPTFKFYRKLSADAIKRIYRSPELYFRYTPQSFYKRSKEGDELFRCNIKSNAGISYFISKRESYDNIRRINKAYNDYFKPFGISREDFAEICFRYNDDYATYLYKKSQLDSTALFSFYNLSDVSEGIVDAPTVLPFLENIPTDCNEYPSEIDSTNELLKKYNNNIKQRKINSYGQ